MVNATLKSIILPNQGAMDKLVQLIEDTCKHPRGSLERQKGMTEIIKLIQRKLWKENSQYYGDALQRTWLYFCRNLCEATTARKFDPQEGTSVITWLNAYLKKELTKCWSKEKEQAGKFVPVIYSDDGNEIDPLDTVAAPRYIPPMLETIKEWLETDPTGELRNIHVKGHPEISCQAVLLRRLPPQRSWKDMSAEFNVPLATLSTFYQRRCLPISRKFAEEQGFL